MEDAGRWALVARPRPAAPSAGSATPASGRATRRACRAHAAAPLRRRVLAAARARGRLAAAVARSAARLPPARKPRRDPRRPLRRRLLRRAVRAARCGRDAARGAAPAGCRRAGVAVGRRSAQPGGHPHARRRGSPRSPATACSIATACRSRCSPPAKCSFSKRWMPPANGPRTRRCCEAPCPGRRSPLLRPQPVTPVPNA